MRQPITHAPTRPRLNPLETAGGLALLGTTSGIEIMLALLRLGDWWAPPLLVAGVASLVVCRRFDPRRIGAIRAAAVCHGFGAVVWLAFAVTAFVIGPPTPDLALKSSFFVVMAGALVWFCLYLLEAAATEPAA